MFAAVTTRETGRHAATRAAWLLGSTALQGGLVTAAVALTLLIGPAPVDETPPPIGRPVILQPPRPPSPPPARPDGPPRRQTAPAPASAMLQPQDVAGTATLDPGPPDPVPGDWGPTDGDFVPGTAPAGPAGPAAVEEVVFAGAGFRAPAMETRGCVQRSVRVPRELAGFVSGTVVVKFAIGRDAVPGRFSVASGEVPDRLALAIWQAVQGCRWSAGADPSGQPTSIWVVMPLRFQAE
jgi:hypothetical protein